MTATPYKCISKCRSCDFIGWYWEYSPAVPCPKCGDELTIRPGRRVYTYIPPWWKLWKKRRFRWEVK